MNAKKRVGIGFGLVMLLLMLLFRLGVFGFSVANMFVSRNRNDYRCLSYPYDYDWSPIKTSQTIINISPNFEILAVLENVASYMPIYLSGDDVFLVGSLMKSGQVELLSLNSQNGQTNWQVCESEAMILDQDRIFVGYTAFSGAFVNAVDSQTGEKIWQTKIDQNGISTIQTNFDDLLVTTNNHGVERYYLLDKQTGAVNQSFDDYRVKNEFLTNYGYTIYVPTAHGLAVKGDADWEIKLPTTSFQRQIATTLVGNVLLIQVDSHSIFQFFAVDPLTGEILWQTERNNKSNLAVEKGVVYFLTGDSILKAVDLHDGHLIGEIQFSPSLIDMSEFDYVNSHPYIAVQNGTLATYFDTSHQLFTFRIQDVVAE